MGEATAEEESQKDARIIVMRGTRLAVRGSAGILALGDRPLRSPPLLLPHGQDLHEVIIREFLGFPLQPPAPPLRVAQIFQDLLALLLQCRFRLLQVGDAA